MNHFANIQKIPLSWYWLLPSKDLGINSCKKVTFFNTEILVCRKKDGSLQATSAYCPHMGANLVNGEFDDGIVKCPLHGWEFNSDGKCSKIPNECLKDKRELVEQLKTFCVKESVGMIWIYPAAATMKEIPHRKDLEGVALSFEIGESYIRKSPMGFIQAGAVDEEHFQYIHKNTTAKITSMKFSTNRINKNVIQFVNIAKIKGNSLKSKFIKFILGETLIHDSEFHGGSTAVVKFGLSFLPLYCFFCYRPTTNNETDGIFIYVVKKKKGLFGKVMNFMALKFCQLLILKGSKEDFQLLQTIKFKQSEIMKFDDSKFNTFVEFYNDQDFISF